MRPKWFGMSTAYTIAKYNMSMCALGMAEEFKGEVAVNTIWPQVPIWTAATQMLYKGGIDTLKTQAHIWFDSKEEGFKSGTATGD